MGRGGSMRACHVVYSYFPFDPRVRREVETLHRLEYELDVIAMQEPGEPRVETVLGARVHRIPFVVVRGGKVRYAFQYLVFVLDLHEAMPEIFAARFRLAEEGLWTALARAAEWMSCAFADRVIVVNDVIRSLLVGRGVDPGKLVVVMNSPDLNGDRGRGPATPSVPNLGRSPKIVYVGGINPERDLEVLIQAAARLHRSDGVSLVIIGYGDSDYAERLRALARSEG